MISRLYVKRSAASRLEFCNSCCEGLLLIVVEQYREELSANVYKEQDCFEKDIIMTNRNGGIWNRALWGTTVDWFGCRTATIGRPGRILGMKV